VTKQFIQSSSTNIRLAFLLVTLAGMMAACTPHILPPSTVTKDQAPADFPEAYYRQAESTGSKILTVDSTRSLVTIIVRRDGALSRLGHDHVVSSRHVSGYVDSTGGRADLYIPLDQLVVDEPALRLSAGLTTQPSEDAINGTRRNMLDKVLESGRYPHALINVKLNPADSQTLSVSITLHGTVKNFGIPAQIKILAEGMEINGQITFNQSDFGITPFSILGGAIRVHDRLDLSFRIIAGKYSAQ